MPVLSLDAAAGLVADLRRARRVVVFTNGVFDLLHVGHVRYLEAARRCGDALIVGINSDDSTRRIKGPRRPITPAAERAEIVAALAAVDAAVIFDEDDPHAVISRLAPDVLVKGADWTADQIIGRDVVESRGGRVVRIPLEPGQSTSALVERIRARTAACDPPGGPPTTNHGPPTS